MEAVEVANAGIGYRFSRAVSKLPMTHLVAGMVMVGYVLYAGIFIYQTSFIYEGERYFVLFDDPMISMQYAKNLADGHGPVWNPGGDRVEGFSNPLWVGYMALVHLLPIPLSKTSLVVQLTGLTLAVATLLVVRRLAERLTGGSAVAGIMAMTLAAFYYPLNVWSLQGNEVSALAFVVGLVALQGAKDLMSGGFTRWTYVLLGASTLIRMDMAAAAIGLACFMAIADRRRSWQHLLWGLGSLAGFLLLQTALRYFYYGEFLPNTYYLKMTGFPALYRITRGAYVFVKFVWNFNWLLFLFPFIYLAVRWNRGAALLAVLLTAQVAYSVYVGGDAWEHRGGANRFIAIAMPLFFVSFSYTLYQLKEAAVEKWNMDTHPRLRSFIQPLSTSAMLAIALVSLLNFNALLDTSSLRMMFLQGRPMFTKGSEKYMTVGLVLRDVTTEDANIAVVGAGGTPYTSGRAAVDLLGKSDPEIAREPARYFTDPPWTEFRPGHMKWDYDRSLGELEPDVVVEFWRGSTDEIGPYLELYTPAYFPQLEQFLPDGRMYFRNDSSSVVWQALELQSPES